jgi:hypothetical protein
MPYLFKADLFGADFRRMRETYLQIQRGFKDHYYQSHTVKYINVHLQLYEEQAPNIKLLIVI